MENKKYITVSQLNSYVKMLLESDVNLKGIYLCGEISNFTNHYKSGHYYLSLKDDSAVVKAVMFKFNVKNLKFVPEDGMKVICKGRISLYERDGNYQFYIDDMEPEGVGALQLAYEQLCEKLRQEGLFEDSHKKPLPKFPERIAIVTSATGAAYHDMINVLSRRYPLAEVTLFPVLVQGENAAQSMIDALNEIEKQDFDVTLIGRGGGSLEDLWAFNDENLARRIYEFSIPIISAVGHEVDFTVCDFVSDLRAPTPSAAAELCVPDKAEVKLYIEGLFSNINNLINNKVVMLQNKLDLLRQKTNLYSPENYISTLYERIDKNDKYLLNAYSKIINKHYDSFRVTVAKLNAYSPLNTLSRGYTLTYKGNGVIKSTSDIAIDDVINIRFIDGQAECKVINK